MIVDGKKIASEIFSQLKKELADIPFKPKIVDVYIGHNPVIESFVNIKRKQALNLGFEFESVDLEDNISQKDLEERVENIGSQKDVCAIIVQLPLPPNFDQQRILDKIKPDLDADAITSQNFGKIIGYTGGDQVFLPPAAAAVLKILNYYDIEIKGKRVLVVGSGNLVGKPSAILLMQFGATVTVANADTVNLKEIALSSDIIISGAGSPRLLQADMVKDGVVVIDAGTSESGGTIIGDVDFESVLKKASLISPVPGGVGPVTVAMLLKNAVISAKNIAKEQF